MFLTGTTIERFDLYQSLLFESKFVYLLPPIVYMSLLADVTSRGVLSAFGRFNERGGGGGGEVWKEKKTLKKWYGGAHIL